MKVWYYVVCSMNEKCKYKLWVKGKFFKQMGQQLGLTWLALG